jgi:hypothetical protein
MLNYRNLNFYMYEFYFNSTYTFLGVAYNALILITFYSGPNKKIGGCSFGKTRR